MLRAVTMAGVSLTILAGCGQGNSPASLPRLQDLLADGDARACAHPDVALTIKSLVQDQVSDETKATDLMDSLKTVTLAEFDAQTKKMTCRARWTLGADGREFGARDIRYSVQPVVTGDDAVITVQNLNYLGYTLIEAARRRETATATSDVPPTQEAAADGGPYRWDREYTPEQEAEQAQWRGRMDELVAEGRRLCAKAANGPLTGDDLTRARGTAREMGPPQTDEDAEVYECLVAAGQAGGQ